ncbi:GNAT family N-acetyltransferase [Actibacterium ureilyticum]|uniref:GNAT family N-acetyltransferase n=1 Tax=Actibacterium ureilyticum TaxID=1590614 RepID=UPI000BAAD7EA|nr:GNAT family N-acetyltransferase [Actibacterium ureilyticum]
MIIEAIVNQPTIAAERFGLRPVRKSDEGLLRMYAGDERVARNTSSIPHPLPPGAAEAFIARSVSDDRDEDVWIMDGSAGGMGELLGVISLKRLDRDQSEIGYWVAPALWNSGIASEAVGALLKANPLDNKTVFAKVFQDNPGSARVLTNAGFEYLGDAEVFSVARNANVATWTYLKKLS